MKTEILNTGTELLLGHVINTNLAWMGRELFALGLRIDRQTAVPDGAAIKDAIAEAMGRADLLIVTGGLGPTSDDITREAAAELLGRPLEPDAAILDKIHAYSRARNVVPEAIVARQAMVPRGAFVLPNDAGTAPGLVLEEKGKIVVLLPGPPRELKPMWRDALVPWLKRRGELPQLTERMWTIIGVGESKVAAAIEADLLAIAPFEVGYCARPGEVDLRLILPESAGMESFRKADARVRELYGEAVASVDGESLERAVVRLAAEKKATLATAESCTGGLVAHRITQVPGSSKVFGYGWVTYANAAKSAELGVPAAILETHGAVSEETARAMAEGARRISGADLAVAVTGIAGPDGGTPEKPVGTVWLALASAGGTEAARKQLSIDRETFKEMASQKALDLLRRALEKM